MSDAHALSEIISGTTDETFKLAGGFDFTDAIALALNAKWRKTQNGPVVVGVVDLAWLLDGYARARLTSHQNHTSKDQ